MVFLKIKQFFTRRMQLDAAKAYAALTLAFLYLFLNTYFYSFTPPPEASLQVVVGTLEIEPMRRGSYLHVVESADRITTFTCDNGSTVFCPSLEGSSADKKTVKAFYSPKRPDLLLKLTEGDRELVAYQRMARRYAAKAFNVIYFLGTAAFALLFCFSTTIHKQK